MLRERFIHSRHQIILLLPQTTPLIANLKSSLFLDRGMEAIGRGLTNLTSLWLDGRHQITDHGLAVVLAANPRIEELSLYYCKYKAQYFSLLSNFSVKGWWF